MNKFEKIFITTVFIADLVAIVFFGGLFLTQGTIIPHGSHDDPTRALLIAEVATEDHGGEVAAPEPAFDWATFVPDLTKGEQIAAKCKACHSFEQGGPHKIGPNLWNIVGKHIMHADGFSYSAAFHEHGNVVWTKEELDEYLENPKAMIPGTKMAFPGIRKHEDRANLIAWLNTLK